MNIKGIWARFRSQKMLSMISSVSGAALGMLTFALLARVLSKPEFGIFGVFVALQSLYDMVRNGLIGQPLIKFFAEAKNDDEEAAVIGSAWRLMFLFSLLSAALVSLAFTVICFISGSSEFLTYAYFFFPLALFTIPSALATWLLTARLRFDRLIWVRTSMQSLYIIGCGLALWLGWSLVAVFWVYLLASSLPSLISLIFNWDGWRYWRNARRAQILKILRFGRYTLGTLLGGSLLNSSDILLIRIFAGNEAVAIYQVPQRLLGLTDIPLRALASYAYPNLVRSRAQRGKQAFVQEFEASLGLAFFVLLPVALGAFFFAEPLVVLLGGAEYAEAAIILQIFAVYLGFTALDRFSGLALDVINRPQVNMKKVIIMVLVNVVGDVAVLLLTGDIVWVAAISIVTFAIGSVVGFRFLKDYLPFRPWHWALLGGAESWRIVKKLVGK